MGKGIPSHLYAMKPQIEKFVASNPWSNPSAIRRHLGLTSNPDTIARLLDKMPFKQRRGARNAREYAMPEVAPPRKLKERILEQLTTEWREWTEKERKQFLQAGEATITTALEELELDGIIEIHTEFPKATKFRRIE